MLQAKLLVVDGRASSSAIELKLPVTIGRDDKAWLRLKHPTISRKHCELCEVDGKILVRDCGSSNGTLVDGVLIKEEAVLEPGHTLTVGPLTFEAQYETSTNGNGEIGLSEAAQDQPDPSAATMLGTPDFTSLTAPDAEEPQPELQAEAPPSPAAETDEAALELDSIEEDSFSISFDDEDDLPEPSASDQIAEVAEDPAAKQAELAPESGDAESEFELDFDLEEEPEISDSLQPEVEAESGPKANNDAGSSVEDDGGVTIEADSDAISDLELDSDFALNLESEAPPAPAKPEAKEAEPAEAPAEEDAPLISEDDHPETPASVTEDIENVRDFSGPVADMPSQILFSVDEIEEPLVEPSDEDSAIEDESKDETTAEADEQIELESLSLDLEDEAGDETDAEPAATIDSAEEDLSIEAEEFSLSDPEPVSAEVDAADLIIEEEEGSEEALTDVTPEPSVEPEASAEEAVSDDLDLMLDAEDTPAEPVELPLEPVTDEGADSSFAISLDDDEDTADGDISDITDVAEPTPKDDAEAVAEDSLSDFDLGLDDLETADSDSLGEFELADDDHSMPNSPDEALPAVEDETPDELDDFSDSAELQWTDPKLAAPSDAEEAKPESEPEADLDLSEMALDALDNSIDLASDELSLGDKSASSDTTDEAKNAALDLSEMALDAVGEPEGDAAGSIELAEDETESADLDLSHMAFETLESPENDEPLSLASKEEASEAEEDIDLSEMALDAVGEPESDTVDTVERVEIAAQDEAESSDLDLSEMAFEAVDDATTDEPSPVIEAAAKDDADSLDLSELALGELDEPLAEVAPAPVIEGADSEAADEDEFDAMIDEVDFSSAEDEDENAVDLLSDADSQVDSLDLSEMAFEVAETNPAESPDSAEPPAVELPEFELDAAEDSSESDAGLPPIDIEPAVEDEGSELFDEVDLDPPSASKPNIVDESGSASDEFEVPELSGDIDEGAVAEVTASESPIEVPSDSASDVDSDDFSAFDFGSDEDQSSEFSMEDASVPFDLPGNSEGSSPSSDAVADSSTKPAAEAPKKKMRSWWPFGRKAKKKKQEAIEAADEEAPVESLLNENVADEEEVPEDEIVNLDAVEFEADEEEEFDTAALVDKPAAESDAEEVAEIPFDDEEPVRFELSESEVVSEDEPSSDLVDDLLFEDEDSAEVDFAAVEDAADEPAAEEAKAPEEEDLGIFEAVESDEADTSGELEVPTFEDDDASSVVSFDAIEEQVTAVDEASVAEIEIDFGDDEASSAEPAAAAVEGNADAEIDLDEISFSDAGEVTSEAGDRVDLEVPTFDDDPSLVSFEADDEEPVTAEEAVAPEIDFDEEPVESSPSASTAEETPLTAKPKRSFWPFGKKKTADVSAKQKVKAPKKKRGWGLGKKKKEAAAEDEPVEQPAASELDVPTFEEEPVAFEPTDEDDPFVAPGDSADDDAMAFLVESSDDQDEVPDFDALDENQGGREDETSSSISADDDSDEFLKQLDL